MASNSVMLTVNPTEVTEAFWVWYDPPHYYTTTHHHTRKMACLQISRKTRRRMHEIRQALAAGEFGDGCTGAKCSTGRKDPAKPQSTQGVFMVYTTEDAMDEVGLLLIHKVRQTIRYKTEDATHAGVYAHKGDKKVTSKTLYWNKGDPFICIQATFMCVCVCVCSLHKKQ